MSKAKPLMDWFDIKNEVHRRGMTLTKLAERHGLHPSVIRKVKHTTLYDAQAVLAAFINRKPEDLWPDRYPKKTSRIFDSSKWGEIEGQTAKRVSDKQVAA